MKNEKVESIICRGGNQGDRGRVLYARPDVADNVVHLRSALAGPWILERDALMLKSINIKSEGEQSKHPYRFGHYLTPNPDSLETKNDLEWNHTSNHPWTMEEVDGEEGSSYRFYCVSKDGTKYYLEGNIETKNVGLAPESATTGGSYWALS